MTRRVAFASITVVCLVMLLLGSALYVRFAHDLRVSNSLAGGPLRAAIDRAATHVTLVRLRRELIVGSVLGALAAAIALVFVTRRALAPVRETADVADRIARTSDLRARVPAAPGTDEVARLTSSMNRMLDRLEASDDALRRLVGDASHELRTPITSLRGNLELLTGGAPVTDSDRTAALADAKAETERLERLVDDLLELARADAAPELAAVPLAELLSELPAEHVTIAPELAGAVLPGDRASLLSMLRNLTDNAERYAGGWSLAATRDARTIVLRVIDHGPGIRPEERTRVFERFARGGAAGGTSGSGIGLAIVAAVVRAHRGEVAIADTPGGGATFIVRLQLSD